VNAPYLPPEKWAAVASAVLLAVSAAAFWVRRRLDEIDRSGYLPAVTR
jgi:hypothetical protein